MHPALTAALALVLPGGDSGVGKSRLITELERRAQLAALLSGLDGREDSADRHDPSAQMRPFEALVELPDLLSERQETVLIREDLQWARSLDADLRLVSCAEPPSRAGARDPQLPLG